MLAQLAMLGGLPLLAGLSLLLAGSALLVTRLGRGSALLAELLVALRSPLAALLATRRRPLWPRAPTLLGRLLFRGVTGALLSWRPLLGWRPLPLPTLLAVLSLSVLGAAVLPSHGTRPDGRTRRSE